MSLHRCNKLFIALALSVVLGGCGSPSNVKEETAPAATTQGGTETPLLPPVEPQTERTHNEGLMMLQAKNYPLAIELFDTVIQAEPLRSGPMSNKALALRLSGKTEEAKPIYLQILKIDPGNAEAYNQLGIVYREAGDFEEAKTTYLAGLEHAPEYAQLHLNMGILLDVYLRQPETALLHYQAFEKLAPESDAPVKLWISDLQQRLK